MGDRDGPARGDDERGEVGNGISCANGLLLGLVWRPYARCDWRGVETMTGDRSGDVPERGEREKEAVRVREVPGGGHGEVSPESRCSLSGERVSDISPMGEFRGVCPAGGENSELGEGFRGEGRRGEEL